MTTWPGAERKSPGSAGALLQVDLHNGAGAPAAPQPQASRDFAPQRTSRQASSRTLLHQNVMLGAAEQFTRCHAEACRASYR
jgi:hypothetical protein